jgi:hypothetical protein
MSIHCHGMGKMGNQDQYIEKEKTKQKMNKQKKTT